LHFSYGEQLLFSQFSAHIAAGVTLIQGGDGRGKSTLLRLLAGALPATSGSLERQGLRLSEVPEAYKAGVFWLDSRTEAFDALSPRAYFASLPAQFDQFDAALLAALVEGLGLAEHQDKSLYMLSTGSKRKVWIAAAIASGAAVLLLDDPFAALDPPSIRFITQLLQAAATQTQRAWVISGFAAPPGVVLAQVIDLGD
jgi:ABC-type multidrug transport system ATPase subunit